GTSVTLEWRVEHGTCDDNVDQVVLTNLALPTTADAGGGPIEQCDNSTFIMSANTPIVGTGMWTVVSGTAFITNPSSPTTTITGIAPGTSATLRWTIDNGVCAESSDDIVLINHASPSPAVAGPDQEQCNDGTFTMAATNPAIGTGTWSVISGSATITSPNSFNTTVTGVAPGTSVTLEWRVENGTCADNVDQVVLTNSALPDVADAGPPEIEQCNNSIFLMSANTPIVGTGQWTLISGTASITNPSSPSTTITGIAPGTSATLRWTIDNGVCAETFDDIILTNHALPSPAVAGPDQEQCNDGTFTMAAADPVIGTGTWSVVSGTATITSPNAFNTTITGVPAGTSVTLEWRVENGTCTPNVDQVVLTNSALPDIADAGPPVVAQCNNSTFFMSANVPTTGTGSWQLISGSATIVNINSPTTTVTSV